MKNSFPQQKEIWRNTCGFKNMEFQVLKISREIQIIRRQFQLYTTRIFQNVIINIKNVSIFQLRYTHFVTQKQGIYFLLNSTLGHNKRIFNSSLYKDALFKI